MKFPEMATVVPEGMIGCASVTHYNVTQLDASLATMRGMFTLPGMRALLRVHGELVMSDTEHERETNHEVVRLARGNVLIAGLGLGMILHPIIAKAEVDHVTVIEKWQDVIDLVKPSLPTTKKLSIVCADIFSWKPPPQLKWDCIYFDIWPSISEDNLDEMATLHRRFGRRKAMGGWMDSWCKAELESDRRRRKNRLFVS